MPRGLDVNRIRVDFGCCEQRRHTPHTGAAAKAHGSSCGAAQTSGEKAKAQTTGVQQGKGFKYIPQPETKYKEVSDKLVEF